MAIVLASRLASQEKNENGEWVSIPLKNTNSILSNIDKFVPKTETGVLVANDRNMYEINDSYTKLRFDSLEMSGFNFKNRITLDGRNKNNAETIIDAADLVFIMGGESLRQLNFFNEINFKELMKKYIHKKLVIGTSAGSMNLCSKVSNFIEQIQYNSLPCLFNGLGFYDDIIIPHFDGETMKNKFKSHIIDPNQDIVLPDVRKRKYIGLPDSSYILLDGESIKEFGPNFIIKEDK